MNTLKLIINSCVHIIFLKKKDMYFSQLFYKNGDNETCAKIKKEYDLLNQIFFQRQQLAHAISVRWKFLIR